MMSASTKRAANLLLSAIFISGAFVVYAALIRPEYAEVQQLRGELEANASLLNEQEGATSQVENLLRQYQDRSGLGSTLALALPEEAAVSSLMAQVNTLSQLSGLTVQSVAISQLPVKLPLVRLSFAKGFGTLRLELRLLGPYGGLKRFLETLETNVRVMDVVGAKIDHVGQPGQDLFNYSLTVDTYYQPK